LNDKRQLLETSKKGDHAPSTFGERAAIEMNRGRRIEESV
jgi:hypothetical protein